ncbi:hypothetical protein [Psittacicella gerlachiana]|uniref:Uncharacterized protein n=1 Tax=Psittacicella gerlachiana TaxID=2028574 RepID=A0A3A1Y367_9GAMM|nr:hypothetical protein [Psittacicella gerlachiana]RIY32673.1 hypothetical protein CKF59_06790 [Psittacicella gerlachiana]
MSKELVGAQVQERPATFLNRLSVALLATVVVLVATAVSVGLVLLASAILGFLLSVAVAVVTAVAVAGVFVVAATKLGIIFNDLRKGK